MRRYAQLTSFLVVMFLMMAAGAERFAYSQEAPRVARIPGINDGPCNPGPEALRRQ